MAGEMGQTVTSFDVSDVMSPDAIGMGATPPPAPLAMPVQDLARSPVAGSIGPIRQWPGLRVILARLVAFGGTLAIAAIGAMQMVQVFGDQPTPMQTALLVLFTLTFAWVGFSFSTALAGFLAPRYRDPDLPGQARIAIVMPVYHENPGESLGLLAALAQDLDQTSLRDRVEFFIASDSHNPDHWLAETRAVTQLRQIVSQPVWYRRRRDNKGRKAGNIADFLRQWGGRYDQMLVLDADSILAADTIVSMSARMESDPDLGLVQTMPMLVGGQTIFARLTQFAGRVYGPAVARGVAAWSGDDGNYWGHNALIRVTAFAQCCGLPDLPGPKPFGGAILSHDFVEAALMRRGGWKVQLHHDLRGSFEGSPPTLLDNAIRERRWAQGNIQHLGVMAARGLSSISRVHFAIGILGFLMSPLWLLMILVGLVLSANVLLSRPEYFPATYQLFPDWPIFDPVRMLWLFIFAMAFLLLPKAIALGVAMTRPLARNAGGKGRLIGSALFEILLSALIAPVQMLIQTRQIMEILRGRDSGWEAQVRAGHMPSWSLVLRRHGVHVAAGLILLAVMWYMAPRQLIWLSPILAGLILSPLTSRYSASPLIGRWARRRGLLLTPEERRPPELLTNAVTLGHRLGAGQDDDQMMDLIAKDPQARADHIALLPPMTTRPAADRLPEISAAAKIAAAATQREALAFLDRAEKLALLGSAQLLQDWASLPE